MEGTKKVNSLIAMFEKKKTQKEPPKRVIKAKTEEPKATVGKFGAKVDPKMQNPEEQKV